MTHKPPQGIDAGLRECLAWALWNLIRESDYSRTGTLPDNRELNHSLRWWLKFGSEVRQGAEFDAETQAALAAPPDPRKDLAIPPFGWQLRAVEEALGKLRDAPLAKFLERGYHFNSQDDRNEAMGLGRDLANGIFDAIAQRLAEMRGAKR